MITRLVRDVPPSRAGFDEGAGLLVQGVLCVTAGVVATLFATAANMGRFSTPSEAVVPTTVAYA